MTAPNDVGPMTRTDSDRPTVTVLIASRNRADDLERTLASLCTQANLTADGWELLVVDNGSTDHTPDVLSVWSARFEGRLRILSVSTPGKSRALNAGLRAARGEVLAMTDDDVICAPDYVPEVQALFSDPGIHSAQGRVRIDWIGGDPDRLDQLSVRLMSLRDFGDEILPWNDNLTGCNMLVRKSVALEVGGFAEELGPGASGFADDSEFSIRLRDAGYQAVYAPGPSVRHQVPAGRISRRSLRDRFTRLGSSYAYYTHSNSPIWRQVASVTKDFIIGELQASWHRLRGRPDQALRRQCETSQRWGIVRERLRFRLGRTHRRLTYIGDSEEP